MRPSLSSTHSLQLSVLVSLFAFAAGRFVVLPWVSVDNAASALAVGEAQFLGRYLITVDDPKPEMSLVFAFVLLESV